MSQDETESRKVRTEKTPVNIKIPIDTSKIVQEEGDCFGKEWDAKNSLCQICADSDVCGILVAEKLAKREHEIEKDNIKFLDSSDWEGVDQEALKIWLTVKTRTVYEMAEYLEKAANTSDDVAVAEYIKRFINSNPHITTKGGNIIVKV